MPWLFYYRFIGLKCHSYALYLRFFVFFLIIILIIIQYAETFIRYIVTDYETYTYIYISKSLFIMHYLLALLLFLYILTYVNQVLVYLM